VFLLSFAVNGTAAHDLESGVLIKIVMIEALNKFNSELPSGQKFINIQA